MQKGFLIETEDDSRKHNPYGSALLVDENNEGFYAITIPLEGIPTVTGDPETFEYNVLTERSKGQTKGKIELEAASTDFFWTKENCNRLDQLKDKVLQYMTVYGNGIGVKFNAELSYRANDVDNGDNLKGTLTITPSSLGDMVYDVRPLIKQTLQFAGTIPADIVLTNKEEYKLSCKVKDDTAATVKATVIGDASDKYTATWADGTLTIQAQGGIKQSDYAMVRLEISDTTTKIDGEESINKYAPYTLFIDLSYAGEVGE